ncbi:MAG: AmmeMemoRadiSam system protein B [Rhodospirillales bacterium]|nr:MAG: AmmeMemoRadiSam system protein B [Rhodospirillales bacterium]
MTEVRYPAVAGLFYPENARDLNRVVRRLLADVKMEPPAATLAEADAPASGAVKAIIVPHAGYPYSGPTAATAYARVAAIADRVRRVVLLGPSHRVALPGLAASSAAAFATPLGPVPVDREGLATVLSLPQVETLDAAHTDEHSLEVHLPFLQVVLGEFSVVPLLVGRATADEVAVVLDRLWGGPETLIVVSSDLSHYLDYDTARTMDAATCRAIESLDDAGIGFEQACGRVPVNGLLALARRRGLQVTTLDLRNSGDTAGDRRRVVGYGAWLLREPAGGTKRPDQASTKAADPVQAASPSPASVVDRHGETLLHVAAASIRNGFAYGRPLDVSRLSHAPDLSAPGACFVTLRHYGALRGCVGSARAHRSLLEDVAANAFATAFTDSRFAGLHPRECGGLTLQVSVLGPAEPVEVERERDLLRLLRPGIDGLIITCEGCHALFLPQVWDVLREPVDFVRQLKVKAGLDPGYWSVDFQVWRFVAASISSESLSEPAEIWA